MGYVEDIESGESFHLPTGQGWKIFVEVHLKVHETDRQTFETFPCHIHIGNRRHAHLYTVYTPSLENV
jgi:hypothetical protein